MPIPAILILAYLKRKEILKLIITTSLILIKQSLKVEINHKEMNSFIKIYLIDFDIVDKQKAQYVEQRYILK